MKDLCLLCLMKPFLLFSSLATSYTSFSCRHSTKPSTLPLVKDSRNKRTCGYVLQLATLISACFEMYQTLSTDSLRDLVSALTFIEFVTMLLVLSKIIVANFFWQQKNRELRLMVYVSEYLKQFQFQKAHRIKIYNFFHYSFYAGIICSTVILSCQIAHYFDKGMNFQTYVGLFNRFTLAYLVSSCYLRIWIDIAAYTLFFEIISKQVSRELNLRFRREQIACLESANEVEIPMAQQGTVFLDEIKKLRRLYMTVLRSLRRTKATPDGILEFSTVSHHLQLTWLLFVTIMGIIGTVELNSDYFVFCTRHVVLLSFMICFARTCDNIQASIEEMAVTLFRLPSVEMNGEEIREIEFFAKLLKWEQPMKSANDKMPFGVSFLGNLTIDIFVNCMVLTQLYFWFNK